MNSRRADEDVYAGHTASLPSSPCAVRSTRARTLGLRIINKPFVIHPATTMASPRSHVLRSRPWLTSSKSVAFGDASSLGTEGSEYDVKKAIDTGHVTI